MNRRCGCFCSPCDIFVLSGIVTGTDTTPAGGIPVVFSINGRTARTVADDLGVYSILAPCGASVAIELEIGLGVTATPPRYEFCPICGDTPGLDFALTPVTIP